MTEHFFAPCPRGLEAMLALELSAIGGHATETTDGGVSFSGPWPLVYRANLESRIASRILWHVGRAHYRSEEDIYRAALALHWRQWFDVARTFRVAVSAIRSPLKSLDFTTLKIKDAVCDCFRTATGMRPNIDTRTPDVRIHAFLTEDTVTFYLDTSGDALFKRGWRKQSGEAPLRENLAAGILRLAGWHPGIPLYDPMCGGGTFLAEAAMITLDMLPGARRDFGFEKLSYFDAEAWQHCRTVAQGGEREPIPLPIYGSDLYGDALAAARANLTALGIEGAIALKQVNVLETSPPSPPGILLANPPYGMRMPVATLASFYEKLGDRLKQHFAGWTAHLFTADFQLAKLIGLKASKRTPLYNGGLECRLFEFKLVAGPLRRPVGVAQDPA